MIQPKPIPPEMRELFDYMMTAAATGNLGLISVFDRETFETRYTLFVRHPVGPGPEDVKFFPVGFLSNTAGEEVVAPGEEPPLAVFVIDEPDRLDQFRAYGTDDPTDIDRWADDGGLHG